MKLHHYVIPSRHNRFDPHLLRTSSLVILMVFILTIAPIYNVFAVGKPQVLGYATNVTVDGVFKSSNDERIKVGASPLQLNNQLCAAATAKAQDMFSDNYWAHDAPDGTTPWTFINQSGYKFSVAGENLAKGFSISSGVVEGWMNSPHHKDNLLDKRFEDVGYAVMNGKLQGDEITLVVAMYATKQKELPPSATSTIDNNVIDSKSNTIDNNNNTLLQDIANTYASLNLPQKISIVLISIIILLFVIKHSLIWRHGQEDTKGVWFKSHPFIQILILSTTIAVVLINSIGVVL